MEDLVSRQQAQYAVAATLAVGSRIVGQALELARTRTAYIDLLAMDVAHEPGNVARLQNAACQAVRTALRDEPQAALAQPIEGGYRVTVLLPSQRPPLQSHELTDVQTAWERTQARIPGLRREAPDAARDVETRARESAQNLADLRAVQQRVMQGERSAQPELADALNRAQMANDALRGVQQQFQPVRRDRPVRADQLVFAVRADGLEGLSLVERDRALGEILGRAAGLRDVSELRVTTRPTRTAGESLVSVAFNLRNEAGRGVQHLNPESLRRVLLAGATRVPAVALPTPGGAAHVSIRAIAVVAGAEAPLRTATRALRELPVPEVVAARTRDLGPERTADR